MHRAGDTPQLHLCRGTLSYSSSLSHSVAETACAVKKPSSHSHFTASDRERFIQRETRSTTPLLSRDSKSCHLPRLVSTRIPPLRPRRSTPGVSMNAGLPSSLLPRGVHHATPVDRIAPACHLHTPALCRNSLCPPRDWKSIVKCESRYVASVQLLWSSRSHYTNRAASGLSYQAMRLA